MDCSLKDNIGGKIYETFIYCTGDMDHILWGSGGCRGTVVYIYLINCEIIRQNDKIVYLIAIYSH